MLVFLASGAEAFEIVTVAVIVLLTMVAIFFLYRSLNRDLKEWRKNKEAMLEREERLANKADDIDDNDELASINSRGFKNQGLLGSIDNKIKSLEEGSVAALFNIDIDDFSRVLDDFEEKDIVKIKQEIIKRLKKYGNRTALTDNLDSDTFLFYFFGEINADSLQQIGEELAGLIKQPIKIGPTNLTASIGVAIFPYDGINAEQLYKTSELAVYVAKKSGKDSVHLYSKELIDSELENVNYYQEIKKSIQDDEFLLYYQTVVDVKTGKIIGLESLLRWNHPTKGILPPSRFLNIMELTGDITWFGTWGFEKTVKQYKDWVAKTRVGDLFISTNLSPKQLEVPGLAKQFHDITKKYGLSPEMFCLEFNNYYQLQSSPQAMGNITDFRKFGFRTAVDDFGSGFEIIEDMPKIQANIIKLTRANVLHIIDRGQHLNNLDRVIRASKEKGKIVIAEGVENEDMIRIMYGLGVRFMQGYHFNQPKSVFEIEKMIMHSPWDMNSFDHLTDVVDEEQAYEREQADNQEEYQEDFTE